MKTRLASVCQILALTLVAAFCLSSFAVAEDTDTMPAHPRFTINNQNYNYVMVGNNPDQNDTALITTWIIPVKLVLSDGSVWDPLAGGPMSPIARTVLSPVFDMTTNYTQGGVDVGTTQYIDAFQRANFWSTVQSAQNYHLLLATPTV